ncbi:hypothetical protein [Micromonospora chersina]|uniref:hypothetical protein n=1 Tax=Micromonospora chersina TaxID=47854 RepID=UPI0033E17A0D
MARTRRRTIRVDGVDYLWTVRHADPGHVVVRVWHAATRVAGLEVLVAFDDPWLNFGPIITAPSDRVAEVFALEPVTPRLVAALIQTAVASGWPARGECGPRRLVLDRSRERLEPAPGTTTGGGGETRVRVPSTGP